MCREGVREGGGWGRQCSISSTRAALILRTPAVVAFDMSALVTLLITFVPRWVSSNLCVQCWLFAVNLQNPTLVSVNLSHKKRFSLSSPRTLKLCQSRTSAYFIKFMVLYFCILCCNLSLFVSVFFYVHVFSSLLPYFSHFAFFFLFIRPLPTFILFN